MTRIKLPSCDSWKFVKHIDFMQWLDIFNLMDIYINMAFTMQRTLYFLNSYIVAVIFNVVELESVNVSEEHLTLANIQR